jgi:prepilin-type N-terminal cleavage/methylation domain-containing protein
MRPDSVQFEHSRPPAFTLVEVLVSLVVVGLVMAGLSGALFMTTKALPAAGMSTAGQVTQNDRVLGELVAELQQALHIRERCPHSITFTLPDRNGDGCPERVRYFWSGTAGDPLLRQYNGYPAVELLADVTDFSFAYQTRTLTEEYSGAPVEGSEQTLFSHTSSSDLGDLEVSNSRSWGQSFTPTLSNAALSWRVTRVGIQTKMVWPADGTTTLRVVPLGEDGWPTADILAETQFAESTLPILSYGSREYSLPSAGWLSPGDSACITFSTSGNTKTCSLRYQTQGVSISGAALFRGTPDWDRTYTTAALLISVYGTECTAGPPQTATYTYITMVPVTLRTGDDDATRVSAAAHLLNTPEVLSGFWELDFTSNPTTLDVNGDGLPDWTQRGGGTFNAGTIANGLWTPAATLDTYPDHDFDQLTVATMRARSTSTSGAGAELRLNVDCAANTCATITARLRLQTNATQTLTVYHQAGAAVQRKLVTVSGLPATLVTVRLLVDPSLNTVNVNVDGADRGTFYYVMYSPSDVDRFASVQALSAAQFDYVSVRVGGSVATGELELPVDEDEGEGAALPAAAANANALRSLTIAEEKLSK